MELLLPKLQQLIYVIVEQMEWIAFRFPFSSFLCLLYTTYLLILSSTVSYFSCSVVYFIFALYLDAPVVPQLGPSILLFFFILYRRNP